jgi:hypothetical protein
MVTIIATEAYSDPRVYIPITFAAVLVGLQYHRILQSVLTLFQRLRLKLIVARRKSSPSIVGTVTSLHIHPGTRFLSLSHFVCESYGSIERGL